MLWQLMENGLEELKLLQTVLVLLTTNTVVHDEVLSKAIVLCFRLHFTKDNITNNTAAATVRQVVTVVFERMVAEDERYQGIVEHPPPVQGNTNRRSVSTLRPSAKDAYMLFQDLCQLVNADAPYWLVGMTEMTRTFGLELLESVLNDFPGVFLQHQEFSFLLKERVCPLVIKLFSPNIKFRQGSSSASPAPVEKPYFPICMRLLRVVSVLIKHFYSLLVTECEIFLSLLVKFLDGEKPQWLRAVAVESVHRLCVQPHLLRCMVGKTTGVTVCLKLLENGNAANCQSRTPPSSCCVSAGDFFEAWEVLLNHIQSAALSKNNEVSLAALKSFQEILQIVTPVRDWDKAGDAFTAIGVPPVLIDPLSAYGPGRPLVRSDSLVERLTRYNGAELQAPPPGEESALEDSALWWSAWNTWYRTGTDSTRPPSGPTEKFSFIPSQPFLTALIQIFPALYQHIKSNFSMEDLKKLGVILHGAVSVPISSDASPFILPSYTEAVLTSLQEAVLTALDVLQKAICVGPENLQVMYPAIFEQLLLFVEFSCKPPQYGRMETKHVANAKYNQIQLFAPAEWVALNYVPFAERSLEVVVDLYHKTACHKAVINEKVLQNIIKTLRMPLGLKYACPSESTWKLAVSSLLKVLSIGLPVARQHASSGKFDTMWPELANAFEDFLFTKSTPPDNVSIQEFQKNEAIDVEVVQLISTEILPFANFIPKDFVGQIMAMLNKGSIHSQSPSFTEAEIDVRMREEFSKVCFETLLQFSFSNKVSTPQEGYISRMALSVLLKRSQDVLRRYVEDERLSGRCPLPRQQVTEIIFVLKAISTLMDSLKKTQPENVDGNTWAQVIALYPTLVECITCSSTEVSSALKEALGPFKDFMQPPVSRVQNGES
ncbi:protein MON2 homolog [Notothenia coriiceps]|uniref:Protein MON2 homolog n=1 Tax=Notothenia coriiceps TaxID=8208 RepID=A0A6I9N6W5_9TELE|nr:PREDICTED: protein MON2 homolog [Notothenia coriiceps]